jgi:hypothetical protein
MTFFERLIDKLAGGPPNEKVLEERKNWFFLSRYKFGVCFPIILTIFLLLNDFVGFTLNPVVEYESLSTLKAQIINIRYATPEFIVQLDNGDKVEMEWPGMFSLVGKAPTSNGPNIGDIKVLKDCQGTIKYAPMRFVLGEHLRIWELHCQNTGLRVSYDQISERFRNSYENSKFINTWALCFVYILSFILFLREKRGNNS